MQTIRPEHHEYQPEQKTSNQRRYFHELPLSCALLYHDLLVAISANNSSNILPGFVRAFLHPGLQHPFPILQRLVRRRGLSALFLTANSNRLLAH